MKSHMVRTFQFAFVLAFTTIISSASNAQDKISEVRAVVDKMFDAIRASDSLSLKSVIYPNCTLTSLSRNAADSLVVHTSSMQGFIKAVGTPHKDKWDEKIYDVKVSIDEPMAIVWAPYKFYLGEKFSHCGVNVFTLVHTKAGWKISGITDTRRRENCL